MAMILLGADNKVLKESIQHKMEAEKKEPCDAKLYDFDDVFYRIFVDPDKREKMLVTIQTPCWPDIRAEGSEDWIKEKLGDYCTDFNDEGANFEIELDEKAPERAIETGLAFSKLRIYALGGPLYRYCQALSKTPIESIFSYQLRRDTHMWICGKADRVTCVFALEYPITADKIVANQILTEFKEVRAGRDLQATPSISYTKDPPLEIQNQKIPPMDKEAFIGYFSILLLPRHVADQKKLETAVENVIGFRAYLTYHIKCAKAFFHQSMRARTKKSLQVLNRARYEPDDQRKKKKIIVGAK